MKQAVSALLGRKKPCMKTKASRQRGQPERTTRRGPGRPERGRYADSSLKEVSWGLARDWAKSSNRHERQTEDETNRKIVRRE